VLVGALVALPPVIGARPASDAAVGAADLRDAALASADRAFSGYAESAGGSTLPVGSPRFSGVADLVSDRTQMRVWWRSDTESRVDVVTAGGETSYRADPAGGWIWSYEDERATRNAREAFSVPLPPDLLPTALGRRLLSEATDVELTRIGAERIAGRTGLGVRVTPAAEASSVDHLDVWVDADSGLPLKVQLYGKGSDLPALDTRFLDLALAAPDPALISFDPPPGARISVRTEPDVLEWARRVLDEVYLPDELAGLPRRHGDGAPDAVGLYGSGATLLAVVPVPRYLGADVAASLRAVPDAVDEGRGVRATAGPLGLMVLQPPGADAYVVTGTVTLDALGEAAGELVLPGDR
jgi:hypothetical protein